MDKTINDKQLGLLHYDGAWVCSEKRRFDGNDIEIVFQAFEDEDVAASQKELYFYAISNWQQIASVVREAISDIEGARITSLFFDRFGSYGFLGECENDEHGIAVKFDGKDLLPEIGEQDILI